MKKYYQIGYVFEDEAELYSDKLYETEKDAIDIIDDVIESLTYPNESEIFVYEITAVKKITIPKTRYKIEDIEVLK